MSLVKRCYFVGPTKNILSAMPAEVKTAVGNSLYLAQTGKEADNAKALKGFGGRGVTSTEMRIALFTPCDTQQVSMFFTFFRKSQNPVLPRRNMKLN